jgi:chromosome segregation ATPase
MAQPIEQLKERLTFLENQLREKTVLNTTFKTTAMEALRDILKKIKAFTGSHNADLSAHKQTIASLQQQQSELDKQTKELQANKEKAERERDDIRLSNDKMQQDVASLQQAAAGSAAAQQAAQKLTQDLATLTLQIQQQQQTIQDLTNNAATSNQIVQGINSELTALIQRIEAIIASLEQIITPQEQEALNKLIGEVNVELTEQQRRDSIPLSRAAGAAGDIGAGGSSSGFTFPTNLRSPFPMLDALEDYGFNRNVIKNLNGKEQEDLLKYYKAAGEDGKRSFKAMDIEELRETIKYKNNPSGGSRRKRRRTRRRGRRGGYTYPTKRNRTSSSKTSSSYRTSSQSQAMV